MASYRRGPDRWDGTRWVKPWKSGGTLRPMASTGISTPWIPEIRQEFEKLMRQEWAFLTSSWPSARKEKYLRSEIKPVNEIAFVKDFVLNGLGVLPVFFFLVVVFGEHEYAGPYNHKVPWQVKWSTRRVSYGRPSYVQRHDSPRSYSYKLKKSGFRTQICIDINQMIIFVSDAEYCGEHNDGPMLSRIDLSHAVSKYDVICLDGAYTLYIGRIAQKNTHLIERSFVYPIRKDRGKDLLPEEVQFNNMFGGFRSMIESVFEKSLASVLLNIKRFVSLGKLEPASHHTLWIQQGFEFGSSQDPAFGAVDTSVSLESILDNTDGIGNLQREFLDLSISKVDTVEICQNMDDGSVYEVECIVDHRTNPSTGELEYLVKWAGYPSSENTWCDIIKFNETECIDDYWKIHDEIFERNAELLNDVAYVDYTIGGSNPRFGWADVPTAFCDSMLFWRLTCASLMRKPEKIGRFLSLMRAPLAMVADELPGIIIKYVYSGLCGERLTVFLTEKPQRALRELGITAKDFKGAYIAIKVSFQQELPLNTVIRCVRQVMRLLEESTVILHDIDIAVDCALISTGAIIKEYLMTLGVTGRDIADDVKDVGLNCISWRRYTTSVPPVMLRTKIYNKFVQMLQSTDVRSKVGS
ncbi:hypothetical protein VTP01DRAFT_8084 [Rhizomucor pusillus]|uniref:uncharacterized protein n=1 Tax=Rhizomucor pusillus TaxID=4840 RepID=UPI003742A3AC